MMDGLPSPLLPLTFHPVPVHVMLPSVTFNHLSLVYSVCQWNAWYSRAEEVYDNGDQDESAKGMKQ
jgi:hypothetical protein